MQPKVYFNSKKLVSFFQKAGLGVGGLDCNGEYRELPYIISLEELKKK